MKHKIALYALCSLGMMGMTSCGDSYLEVNPYTGVSPEDVTLEAKNVYKELVGVYNTLYTPWGDWLMKPHIALANYATLDVECDGWDYEYCSHAWTVNSTSKFFESGWNYSYTQVAVANTFLADLKNVKDDVVDPATKKIYEAEARAIRAYAYYFLTVNFSRVPLQKEGETYTNTPNKARPESDEEAWNFIYEDFKFAADNLDWKPAQPGRFTKGAALAYAAKAKTYLGDYEAAKKLYKQIVDSQTYSLNPVYAMTSWPDNPGNQEAVWEISFPQYTSMMNGDLSKYQGDNDAKNFDRMTRPREYNGWGDAILSYEFVRCFEPDDKRLLYTAVVWDGNGEPTNTDSKGQPSFLDSNGNDCRGGVNPINGFQIGTNKNSGAFQHWFLMNAQGMPNNHCLKWWKLKNEHNTAAYSANLYRYAGVLMDYAECCFRTGEDATGWDILDQIRERGFGNLEVGADPNATTNSTYEFPVNILRTQKVNVPKAQDVYTQYKADKGYTLPAWQVALIQERRKEFTYEYSNWYDLTRQGSDVVKEYLDKEYPKNDGATFYNTETKQYLKPTLDENGREDYNEPWESADRETQLKLIPVSKRDWDWNPIHMVYPIPLSELSNNHLCKQNPGY